MSLQAFIARTLLKLPPGMLVRLSGGAPHEIGGRTLDPHLQFIAHGAKRQPDMASMSVEEARAASGQGLAMFAAKPAPGVYWDDFELHASDRKIPVRLYRADHPDGDIPMLVYFHFGGGVIGDLETCHAFCSMLAAKSGGPVLSVDYRLAPEHPWPAGLEDCRFAYEWALRHGADFGAPDGVAALGGDSMGGNFTAILAQEAKRNGLPAPSLQVMIYPAIDLSRTWPSHETYGETYPLSRQTMDWFMGHYLPEGADRADLQISPGQESDLTDLPPAIVITAGFDPLVDEGQAYGERLDSAGVETVYRCYDSLAHGFTAFTAVSPAAEAACQEIAADVARALKG
jgi:acetyl esterase